MSTLYIIPNQLIFTRDAKYILYLSQNKLFSLFWFFSISNFIQKTTKISDKSLILSYDKSEIRQNLEN